jgi:hypothetical protein
MSETMTRTGFGLYPQHAIHRRFTAYGRSTAPLRKRASEERSRFVVLLVDVASSGAFPERQEMAWWKASGASLDRPLVQFRSDPFERVLEARWDDFAATTKKPARSEATEGQIEEFLEEVYRLGDLNDLQGATDKLFKYVDDLLLAGAFPVCNEVLKRVDAKRLPAALMRSFLTITAAAKEKLPARGAFYRDAFSEMVRLKGDADKARRLLGRLA